MVLLITALLDGTLKGAKNLYLKEEKDFLNIKTFNLLKKSWRIKEKNDPKRTTPVSCADAKKVESNSYSWVW